jgi:ERCC4-type nuclease
MKNEVRKMKITVDSREQARLVQPIVDDLLMEERWKDIEVVRQKLEFGDYLVENEHTKLLIERKTISDFVNSYAKGHLKDKLFTMRLLADRTMLLIEGRTNISGDRIITYAHHGVEYGIERKTMFKFLIGQQDKGTIVWFTNSLEDTLYQIFLMAENLGHLEAPTPSCKCGNPKELLLQLPGLGAKKLAILMEKYKSPTDALAHIEEWQTPVIKKALKNW